CGAVAGRPRRDRAGPDPELLDLPPRRDAVRLLRVRRRRLRVGPGGDRGGPRDAALVGAHGRDAGARPGPAAGHVVARPARGVPHGLSCRRGESGAARPWWPLAQTRTVDPVSADRSSASAFRAWP